MIDAAKIFMGCFVFVAAGADACGTSRQFDIVSEYIASIRLWRPCAQSAKTLAVFRSSD
jgi:hypothetical protein